MTAIDWTKPVETAETPPRPVRVLTTDRAAICPIVIMFDNGDIVSVPVHGCGANNLRLRNVPPPKPKPVLHVKWCLLEIDGTLIDYEDEAEARSYQDDVTAECRRVAWMSDGSPVKDERIVPEELGGGSWKATADHWKAKAEASQARLDEITEAAKWLCKEINGDIQSINPARPRREGEDR